VGASVNGAQFQVTTGSQVGGDRGGSERLPAS